MGFQRPRDPLYRAALWLLRTGAIVGPARWREEGLPEWEAELWALRQRGCSTGELLRFAASGAAHALWRRGEGGWGMFGFAEDARLAIRRLVRAPGFTCVTVLILALGIGANTALFGALVQALRGASQYASEDRLVMADLLLGRNAAAPLDTLPWSYPKFELARRDVRSVEELSGFSTRATTLTGAGDAARLTIELVTPSYFGLLGVNPLHGRTFALDDEPPAPGAVALLGHTLWAERFGGDPTVVGRTITLDGASFEVVGVMPAGFRGLTGRAQLWLPMSAYIALGTPGRLTQPWTHWLRGVGRLGEGVTIEQAGAELEAIGLALTEAYPDPNGGGSHGVALVPFLRARVNPVARQAVAAVSAGGFLLLLIGCANVAGLLFARASSRRTDFAVRAAMGAPRRRLVRESLVESVLLAALGGAAGLLLALTADDVVAWAVRYALETSGSRNLEYLNPDSLRVDGLALALGAAMALLIGVAAGLLPVRASIRPDLSRDLRASSAGSFQRRHATGETLRGMLVSVQLALTLLLLAGAGLMASSFVKLAAVGVGFTNENVLVLDFDGGPGREDEAARAFERGALERIAALPGVVSAATGPCPPLTSPCEVTGIRQIDDGPLIDFGEMESILTYEVSSGYFSTLGVDVLEGRSFPRGLTPEDALVAVVSETTARKYFGGSAVGHRIRVTHSLTDAVQAEIVGVVSDVRYGPLEEEALPALYFAREQTALPYGTLFVRTDGDPDLLVEPVRSAVRGVDPSLPLTDVTTMAELEASATARTRVLLGLLAAFSMLGLLLCAVGVYGVVSYDVTRRARETGLRIALGASALHVLRTIGTRPALFACLGGALGLGGAFALTSQLGGLLFQVEARDPRVLAAAAALLVAVAVAAAWLPTQRALRMDPAETLRGE